VIRFELGFTGNQHEIAALSGSDRSPTLRHRSIAERSKQRHYEI
jgi:hypothetical protein